MGTKTKIIVLHMKEIIYTAIFAVLAIVLILLLVFMFLPKGTDGAKTDTEKYLPGVYTSTVSLNNMALEVEVTVDESHINSIRFSNLDETVAAMYPLVQPTIEDIAEQVYKKQSTEDIQYSEENPYTSQAIINAIDDALKKAAAK